MNTRPVKFPELEGLPEKTIYHKKIFGMKKDRAIILTVTVIWHQLILFSAVGNAFKKL
ncbi:MAG: hypothetical protein R3A12_10460 [Ignavibacteria bacterium]